MSVISLSGLFSLLCILLMLTEATCWMERGKASKADLWLDSAMHKIRPADPDKPEDGWDLLGKVFKEEEKITKVGTGLEKDSACNGCCWLCDPVVQREPGGIFADRQAGRQGGGRHTSLSLSQRPASALPAMRSE